VVVADLHELRNRRRPVAHLGVEVAQRVGGADVAGLIVEQAEVLLDREIDLALANEILGFLDGRLSIYAHAAGEAGRKRRIVLLIPSYQTASRA
jgi:hypothetical protein